MPPRNLGNRNPGSERLGDDPPLLLHRPAPAASYPGANVHPPARELRVGYSVAHMCETFPPNHPEDCNIPRASIKVGWEPTRPSSPLHSLGRITAYRSSAPASATSSEPGLTSAPE